VIVAWQRVAEGDAGIVSTLDEMRRQMLTAITDPALVQTARLLVQRAAERRDPAQMADAIFQWVQERYRYVADPVRYDLLMPPALMLREIAQRGYVAEDCESVATLLAVLMESVGIPTRFHVVSQSLPTAGDAGYAHVWTDALIGRQWTPYDATLPEARAGDRPQGGITAEAIYTDRLYPVQLGRLAMYYATSQRRPRGLGQNIFEPELPDTGPPSFGVPAPEGPPLTAPSPFESEQATYPVSTVGSSPTFPGAPSPGTTGRETTPIDWGAIFGGAAKALAVTLPALERYGALTPAPTVVATRPGTMPTTRLALPAFLQYPNLPFAGQYAASLGVTPQTLSQVLVWGGGAVLVLLLVRQLTR